MSGGAPRSLPYVVLVVALVAVSNGAILARLADAPAIAIAAWRVGLALLVVLPLAAMAPQSAPAGTRGRWLAIGAGVLLAVHFMTWIASLGYTRIARSVLFVCMAPVWVALLEFALGRGRPGRVTLLALALTLGGAGVVSGSADGGGGDGGRALRGDLLAASGGLALAGYFLLSQSAQRTLPFRSYLATAYGSAAGVLWLTVLVTGTAATGFSSRTWWALAGMAAVSQVVGHSGYNWALRQVGPQFVSIVSVGEPVLASLLAWWLLGEPVDGRTAAGGGLVLCGIALATVASGPRR